MRHFFSLLILLNFILSSCSSLRHASDNRDRINIADSTINLLTGKYNESAIDPIRNIETHLAWNIFDWGYNPKSKQDFIEIEAQENRKIKISYWDSTTLIKSKVFKGKFKHGYFIFKRRYLIIPAILVNLYRNRVFRIGLLSNKNLITDYNQISMGSFYVILPYLERKKEYGVEFKLID